MQPADSAFIIWPFIYLFLIVFVVYQSLPSELVPDRNNELIFDKIGWLWAINMVANIFWVPLFQLNTTTGFFLSQLVISVLLSTALLISKEVNAAELNWIETIGLKWGSSLYSGWLSVATILNTGFVLKGSGISEDWDEGVWSVIMLWVAMIIYCAKAYLEEDPIYAAVYVWALFGIKDLDNADIASSVNIVIGVMSAFVATLTGMQFIE